MAILGNAVKGTVKDQESGNVLSMGQLSQIQRVLLMVLDDVDEICRSNQLRYVLIGGTAIGCVRHKGFIPWDDDIDIAMPRADYETFRTIIERDYAEKYSMTDAMRRNNFGKLIPKLRLKNTVYRTALEFDPSDREITCDVFIIENVPNNALLRGFHGVLCMAMGFFVSCRRVAEYRGCLARFGTGAGFQAKVILGTLLRFASLETWANWTERCYALCRDDDSQRITVPTDRRHYFGEIFPREIMCEMTDAAYEDRTFLIPKAYDYYLTERYGAYMEVPPKEKQVLSKYSMLDFGPYRDLALGEEKTEM